MLLWLDHLESQLPVAVMPWTPASDLYSSCLKPYVRQHLIRSSTPTAGLQGQRLKIPPALAHHYRRGLRRRHANLFPHTGRQACSILSHLPPDRSLHCRFRARTSADLHMALRIKLVQRFRVGELRLPKEGIHSPAQQPITRRLQIPASRMPAKMTRQRLPIHSSHRLRSLREVGLRPGQCVTQRFREGFLH